jgi:hypothetical protein
MSASPRWRRVPVLVRGAHEELERMDRARELLGEDRMYSALALHAAFASEACGHDFQAKMGLLAALRTRVMAGMKMRIVINSQALGL